MLVPAKSIEETFRNLEQSLHRPEVRSSRELVESLLASDFSEIGASGQLYDRSTTVDGLLGETPAAQARLPIVQDFVAAELAEDVVLVTYRSIREASEDLPERATLRSSIWMLEGGNWRMRFHQGTIIPST